MSSKFQVVLWVWPGCPNVLALEYQEACLIVWPITLLVVDSAVPRTVPKVQIL